MPALRVKPRAAVGAALATALLASPLLALPATAVEPTPASSASGVVISEAYTNGGSANAPYKNKFVELYNGSDAAVSVDGWSVQYRSAAGTAAPTGVIPLTGSVPAKGHYLVAASSNGATGAALPAADATGGTSFAATAGTLVLADRTTAVPDLPTGSITDARQVPGVVDVLGYGTSNTFETTAAAAPAATTDPKSITRSGPDTDDNGADFTVSADVTPQNTASSTAPDPSPSASPTSSPTVDPTSSPTTAPATVTPIARIQGSGSSSGLINQTVTTRGRVTAAYPTGGFNGYYLQTAGTGGDVDLTTHRASDAVFVYSPATVGDVKVGDYIQVTGTVGEYYGLTQLSVPGGGVTALTEAAPEVKATTVGLPTDEAQKESLEGMLVAPAGDFTVTDNYSLNRYGEIGLTPGSSPLLTPTVAVAPGAAARAAAAQNTAKTVRLDDGATTDFLGGAANQALPLPYLTPDKPIRVGAQATFTTDVVLDYRNNAWKYQPLVPLTAENADTVQPATFRDTRQAAPKNVAGAVKIATFNMLNYFTTTGDSLPGCRAYTDRAGNPVTVKDGCQARGAWDAANLKRQQDKHVTAINGLTADVVALEEIENSAKFGEDRDDALKRLVAALNAGTGTDTWAYVPSPAAVPPLADEDVIRTAFIYKKAAVQPVGDSAILLGSPAYTNAREPLAQVFTPVGAPDASRFMVIGNHFKSKGASGATGGNVDSGDGQGAYNADRVRQADALLAFAEAQKKDTGVTKVFLVGDFNSYAKEDPVQRILAAGYVSQGAKTGKQTYAFGGAVGSLDHVFASPEADAAVTGADIWDINADEPVALEYSRYNNNATNFYRPDAYRSSDHDPILVGLNPASPAGGSTEINLLNINDLHGRIDSNTVNMAGTVEQLKAAAPSGQTVVLSAGDNIGASLFASSVAQDQPTIDVLNALGMTASAVGNHEFDQGWPDLRDRVRTAADWSYLGANVYAKGTKKPVLDEYRIVDVKGVKVAVIGTVTQETPTLVSPGGITDLDFGDPVEAVNRVATRLHEAKLADVIVAEYHEGAGAGTPDKATLAQEVAAGGAFAKIVTGTSPWVNAIFTGHTQKQYAWEGAVPGQPGKTRPILQTGSYGENIGQITLTWDPATSAVTGHHVRNVPRTSTPADQLVATYPAVAKVKQITDAALAKAAEVGNQPVGKVTGDITTAFIGTSRDDRASESTLGHLVADALLDRLKDPAVGGAEISVVNPGGLRNELYYASADPNNPQDQNGTITYAEANAVLPFVNNLWTTSLTGAQVKTLLEQQWQPAGGSRSFLALSVSKNMTFTFDPAQPAGAKVTSVRVNGQPLDPARSYRVGTFSFLAQGGDNFTVFKEGTNTRDSGLIDRDAWIAYLKANSPVSPDFARRGVQTTGLPSGPVVAGSSVSVALSSLDLTSLGSPTNTTVAATFIDAAGTTTSLGSVPVTGGSATVRVTVPAGAPTGAGVLRLVAAPTSTTVDVPATVRAATPPGKQCVAPTPPTTGGIGAWLKYFAELVRYGICRIRG
ncbi:multifunctional nuclease/2',3'-cyclic-nucleotide 2'-phosphodiesterase/5'-nucleotidase/3'-nucleotidase [Tersicoccus phoenicis]|uniref:Multifunctional nuclease/2',3'-cyclic-nucleotide 2'-phosphodiesterase/5'-nucleotidase/3'-nucleotidase n=1 Tax=Tersicoccus phoenicis TaxID=554083 RepID=A0A1R1L827_9MICC|nr:ExeM/NucH family extracellular endonuclease [Tersicoccus phoenicis]OMH23673.1 multifunctional nuclease/2',3'-cyclic-nucleotide 2'-phosphodiesterase/5'-nucleotidase/3'-nucleotidase [Tersicoccus phoenicis]